MIVNGVNKIFIGEVKPMSPTGFKSDYSFNQLMAVCLECADLVCINTSALFGGCLDTIGYVAQYTKKPIIARGIFPTDKAIREAINYGASYCMISNRIDQLVEINLARVIFEINDNDYLTSLIQDGVQLNPYKIMYDTTSPLTGEQKEENLLPEILKGKVTWIGQKGKIKTIEDINPNVGVFSVGENLVEFCHKYPPELFNHGNQ